MFDNKIFTNFIVVLTNCDKEDNDETLQQTIFDHKQQFNWGKLPVLKFYGKGNNQELSKSELLKIFREYAKKID